MLDLGGTCTCSLSDRTWLTKPAIGGQKYHAKIICNLLPVLWGVHDTRDTLSHLELV
jgi:hypothetical protein